MNCALPVQRSTIEVLRLDPDFKVSRSEKTSPNRNREYIKRYGEALRKAGLPN